MFSEEMLWSFDMLLCIRNLVCQVSQPVHNRELFLSTAHLWHVVQTLLWLETLQVFGQSGDVIEKSRTQSRNSNEGVQSSPIPRSLLNQKQELLWSWLNCTVYSIYSEHFIWNLATFLIVRGFNQVQKVIEECYCPNLAAHGKLFN